MGGIPVTATANGSTVNLASAGTGLGSGYSVSIYIADSQTASFPSASFSASPSTGGSSGSRTLYRPDRVSQVGFALCVVEEMGVRGSQNQNLRHPTLLID